MAGGVEKVSSAGAVGLYFDALATALTRDGARKVSLSFTEDSELCHDWQLLEDLVGRGQLSENFRWSLGRVKGVRTWRLHLDPSLDWEWLEHGVYFLRSLGECLCDADSVFTTVRPKDFFGFLRMLKGLTGVQSVKAIKYWTCWPMAKWLRNDLPPLPSFLHTAGWPVSGRTRSHLRNLWNSRTTSFRAAKVMITILNGVKRGCAPVSEAFQIDAMKSHQEALTRSLPPLSEDCRSACRQKFMEIWGRTVSSDRTWNGLDREGERSTYKLSPVQDWLTWRRSRGNPNGSSCFEATRSRGGRAGMVRDTNPGGPFDYLWERPCDAELKPKPVSLITTDRIGEGPLSRRIGVREELLGMVETSPGVVEAIYGLPVPSYTEQLRRASAYLFHEGNRCKAVVHPILEPLKCRLITRGSGLPYTASQTAQKRMWEMMRRHECCALIGEPVNTSHLYSIQEKAERSWPGKFDKWVSGDYSAATDGLTSEINRVCFDAFLDRHGATTLERTVWKAVIGNHQLSYPPWSDIPSCDQTNGQLMGSPLSFPILCAINLTAYWLSLEEYLGQKVALCDLPVLVNGDDIVFRSNSDHYVVWQRWIGECGFTMSPGKNYISPDIVTINSEYWQSFSDQGTPKVRLVKVPYLNAGLLLEFAGGPHKVALRPENREAPLDCKLNELIASCANPRRTQFRIRHYFRDQIEHLTNFGEYSLYAHPQLGGVGLSSLGLASQVDYYFTPFQMKLASYLRNEFLGLDGTSCRKYEPPAVGTATRFVDVATRLEDFVPRKKGGCVQVRVSPVWKPCGEFEERFSPAPVLWQLWNDSICQDVPGKAVWKMKGVSSSDLKRFRQVLPSIPHGLNDPGRFDWELRYATN